MTTKTEIDLTRFCGTNDLRVCMSMPFVLDGWRYATDARICVRVPAEGEPNTQPPEGKRIPRVDQLPGWGSECALAWPEPNTKEGQVTCQECSGSGRLDSTDCTACDGTGSDVCPTCGHEEECEKCDGDGYIGKYCDKCGASGKVIGVAYQVVSPAWVAIKYDALIRSLPNVRYRPPSDGETPIPFVFDGGQGLICPVSVGDPQ